jgi:hypothetical protein
MTKRLLVIALSAFILMSLAGCSKPPQVEMQNADAAIQSAKAAEAEQYAPAAYRAAMDSLSAAMASKQQQDSKFALIRGYGKAKEMFLKAEVAAKLAEDQARKGKAQAKVEVEELMKKAQEALDAANTALSKAPRGKGSKVDLALFKNDLATATAGRDEAMNDYNAEKYLAAKSKISAVIQRAQRISQDIAAASGKK